MNEERRIPPFAEDALAVLHRSSLGRDVSSRLLLSNAENTPHSARNPAVCWWFVASVGWLLSAVLLPTLFAESPLVGEGPDAQHVGFVLAALLARAPASTEVEGVVRIGHGRCLSVSSSLVESLSVGLSGA
jgi:hypothetical protein